MERKHLAKLSVNPALTLADLQLDRSAGLDDASRGLARISEAQIVRSIHFPAGALSFTLAPDDPESGGACVPAAFALRCRSVRGSARLTDQTLPNPYRALPSY